MELFALLLLISLANGATLKKVVCEFYDNSEPGVLNSFFQSEDPEHSEHSEGGKEEKGQGNVAKKEMICGRESQFCYALWTSDGSHSNSTDNQVLSKYLKQGCWEASPPHSPTTTTLDKEDTPKNSGYCQRPNCTAFYKKDQAPPHMHFCCCQGDYCNSNVQLLLVEEDFEEIEEYENTHNQKYYGFFFFLFLFFFLILILTITTITISKKRKQKQSPEQEQLLISDIKAKFNLQLDIDSVIDKELAMGRWGRIYSANKDICGSKVALKVYKIEHREFFDNEKFIYECIGKNVNVNVVQYFGWSESVDRLLIVMELVEMNLREFLKSERIGSGEVVDICLGVSRGVAYLHGGVNGCVAVAHRDLTSRNVLIDRASRRVKIADFGLSLLTNGSKYFFAGRERQAEFCSLSEAGTLRYMAPELLEGAVNLKDCENALKQADVYSLALILWEVAHACEDLRMIEETQPVSFHSLPYDEEAGNKDILQLDSIVRLVVQARVRPSFHTWTDNGLTRALRDTLSESWDSEPDARLTSLCIVERILDLKNCLNNKFVAKSGKALEKKRVVVVEEPAAWVNRNPCMERNLLFDNGSGSVTDTNSVVTMATNLSSGGSTDGEKFINTSIYQQPRAIQLIQNIQRK